MKRYIVMYSVRNGVQVEVTYNLTRQKLSKASVTGVALHNKPYTN